MNYSIRDLLQLHERTPPTMFRSRERKYRKGFRAGVRAAAEKVRELYAAQYHRPTEIANILDAWTSQLDQWVRGVSLAPMDELKSQPPELTWEKWSSVRRAVLARDGKKCVQCGATERLEVHHIHPVSEGGLPLIENLKTLCERCHDVQ